MPLDEGTGSSGIIVNAWLARAWRTLLDWSRGGPDDEGSLHDERCVNDQFDE